MNEIIKIRCTKVDKQLVRQLSDLNGDCGESAIVRMLIRKAAREAGIVLPSPEAATVSA